MPHAACTFGFPIHNIEASPVVRSLTASSPPFRMTSQEVRSKKSEIRLQILDCRFLAFLQSPAASTAASSSDTTFSFTLALVTRITDTTTIALPARMNRSTFSCNTSHPRNTATTGFTYAYVDTFEVGTCSSSQM